MKYKTLGETGIDVSIIGLGSVKLGRNQGVKYPAAFKIPDDTEALSLIQCAKTLGVNLIDTAPAYGNSEERLGFFLQNTRKDWVICSKVGEEFENGLSSYDFSRQHTIASIERSLKRLRTDYIDIVLVHSDGNDLEIINTFGTLDVLADLKRQGKIRAFGLSGKTIEGGIKAAEQSDVVMVTYNLNEQTEKPVLDFCRDHHKGVLIKKALASGHLDLSGKTDPIQASMDFIFRHDAVSSAIIGTLSEQHLKHNIECALKAFAACHPA